MEHFIKYVHINNFKSIADLELEDCRRINLFIGYPNVGKSNVLEALELFSVPFLEKGENLNKLVRVENAVELFHSSSEQNLCTIDTNLKEIELLLKPPYFQIFHKKDEEGTLYSFNENLNSLEKGYHSNSEEELKMYDTSNIKRYIFNQNNQWKSDSKNQLLPPFGENIIDVLSYNPNMVDVLNFIQNEFRRSGLQLVLNKKDKSILVQRNVNKEVVLLLPYSSLSDTLQRIIFYKTAIASNKNSVLLFEEPEAHAFPPYIQTIMNDIIDAESNQFFIVTHSPLVVNAFLEYEKLRKETSIYLFDYKNDQTTAKRLSDEEMELAYEYGDDLFFNLENLLVDGRWFNDNEKPHYIVKISKAAEDFILKNAKKCGISMADFNLPDHLPDLIKQTKNIAVKTNPNLKRLFSALKQNENSDFYKLAQWIEAFKENPYSVLLCNH